MKKKLIEYSVLCISLLAITFMIGFYFGQKQVQHITITAEKGLQAAAQSQLPVSASEETLQAEQTLASQGIEQETIVESSAATTEGASPETEAIQTAPVVLAPININMADLEMLDFLPGIGPALAQRIVTYRDTNGPFGCIEDIKKVSGIGDKKFEAMKDLITVEDAS